MIRDITRALKLVDEIEGRHPIPGASSADFEKLRKILRDIDARTGTKDPSVKAKAKMLEQKAGAHTAAVEKLMNLINYGQSKWGAR